MGKRYNTNEEKWEALQKQFPFLTKDYIIERSLKEGALSFFHKEFIIDGLGNPHKFLNWLGIELPHSLQCPNCGIKFSRDSYKNIRAPMLRHLEFCNHHYVLKNKYPLNKEWLDSQLDETGSVQSFLIKYPDFGHKQVYQIFKIYNVDTSVKRASNHSSSKQKRMNTLIERTGYSHNFCKDSPSRKKWEKELLDREGITNVFQRDSVKEKVIDALINKYGAEDWKNVKSNNDRSTRGSGIISKINKQIFDMLEQNNISFVIEYKIRKDYSKFGYYAYDIYIDSAHLLIEVNGDYWHANPKFYKESDIVPISKNYRPKASEIWQKDVNKVQYAIDKGYTILVIWEYDLKNNYNSVVQEVLKYVNGKNKSD